MPCFVHKNIDQEALSFIDGEESCSLKQEMHTATKSLQFILDCNLFQTNYIRIHTQIVFDNSVRNI